jgi:hypothetical protein
MSSEGGNGPIWNFWTYRLAAYVARFPDLLFARPEPAGGALSTAICSGLPVARRPPILPHCHDDLPAKDRLRRNARDGRPRRADLLPRLPLPSSHRDQCCWADHVRLLDIEPKFFCQVCGQRGGEIRPKFGPAKMGVGAARPQKFCARGGKPRRSPHSARIQEPCNALTIRPLVLVAPHHPVGSDLSQTFKDPL